MKRIFSFLFSFLFSLVVPASVSAESSEEGDPAYLTSAGEGLLPDAPIYGIIGGTMDWILAIFGFIAIIGFVVSGILYLTAAGNDGQIKQAKEAMKWSIVGVIVALIGYVILQAVDSWLAAGTHF